MSVPPKRNRPTTANREAAKKQVGDGFKTDSTSAVEALTSPRGPRDRQQPINDPRTATRRRYWAREYIDRGTAERPAYGSTAWLCLPDDHPDKVAACVVAAECWATQGDELVDNLRREIAHRRHVDKQLDDAEYRQRALEHRAQWSGRKVSSKSFTERRAEQLEAAKPRPGDHPGGPVTWDGGAR